MASAICLLLGVTGASSASAAGITIGAGETGSYDGVTTDLGCNDLVVNGSLTASGATFNNIGSVIIGAGGSLTAPNATFHITSRWQNQGSFSGPESLVSASTSCANTNTVISGNNNFHDFTATGPGLQLDIAAGSEQIVSHSLTLADVTLIGQGGTAYLTLLPDADQNISAVGVNDVNASRGQLLASGLTNAITGPAVNWFSAAPPPAPRAPTPVPTTGPVGLSLMGLLVGLSAYLRRRKLAATRS